MNIAMRLAEIEKKTKRYPTDLTDAEWLAIEPVLPRPAKTGRRRQTDLREILNAIRYMARSAGGWRMLPKDFPPWQTVYWWFRHFVRRLMFQTIHDVTLSSIAPTLLYTVMATRLLPWRSGMRENIVASWRCMTS